MREIIKKHRLLFVILIIAFVLLISKSMSKYAINIEDEPYVQESTVIYFESEIANVEGKEYKINNWDGISTQTIEIDASNYINSLLKTSENITFKIEPAIIDDSTDSLNDEDLIEIKLFESAEENTEIDLTKELVLSNDGFNQSKYKLKIIPKVDLENGKTFKIELTLNSIKPYEKQLKANLTIVVNKIENYIATLTDSENGEYVTLNLKINNCEDDITIKYDNTKLILDKSSYLVNNTSITKNNNKNSFTIAKNNLEKGKNYEIYFIKQEENIILGEDIMLWEGNIKITADTLGIQPKINAEEMTPVKYENGKWVEADHTLQGDWFEYSEKKWANVETENGYFVYIPRFAYKITSGYHETLETAGNMEILFLDKNDNILTKDSNGNSVDESELVTADQVNSSVANTGINATTKYIIHPAFTAFDTENQKCEGLWVAKYEMSMEETTDGGKTWVPKTTTDSTIGDILTTTDTTKRMVAKEGVSSWRNIQVTNIFDNCYNMNRILDSHMMKNTEWGAAAYLTVSQYGKGATNEVEQNTSSEYLTGYGANGTLSTGEASTTGNMYGIFDMSGGMWEYVAAYLEDECMGPQGKNYNYNKSLIEATEKYKDAYTIKVNQDNTTSNTIEDCYEANKLRVGDGLWEVTSQTGGVNTWYKDLSNFAGVYFDNNHYPVFNRGGYEKTSSLNSGVFYSGVISGDVGGSFRAVCIVL